MKPWANLDDAIAVVYHSWTTSRHHFQTLDPANRELRLIPLLRAECDKPLRIGALTHIDFKEAADLDLAWRQLLTALGAPPEPEAVPEPSSLVLGVGLACMCLVARRAAVRRRA